MGKSIRSKREKRLRTSKREIVEPRYDAKERTRQSLQFAAALAAPKIELPKRREEMEDDSFPSLARSSVPLSTADGGALPTSTPSNLKATGGIRKRGKSKKGHKSKPVLKSKKKKGLQF